MTTRRPFNGAGEWAWFNTENAQTLGYTDIFGWGAKGIAFGLSTGGSKAVIPCYRDIVGGGFWVRLDDTENPTVNSVTGLPTSWVGGSITAKPKVSASDPGLGVRNVTITPAGMPSIPYYAPGTECPGGKTYPCPASTELTFNLSSAQLPEGEHELQVTAIDPLGKEAASYTTAKVKVDKIAPSTTLSGTLTEQATLGIRRHSYALKASITDGSEASPQSGLAEAKMEFDNTVVATTAPKCSTKNCTGTMEWTVEASKYAPGPHTVLITATDAVGLTSKKELRVNLNPWAEADPIAAYSFDENEGTVAHDSVNHHDAKIEGAEWASGKFGSALEFNAKAKSALTIPGTEDLRFENFTLEAWVDPSESRSLAAIIAKTNPTDYGYALYDGGETAGKPEGFITNHTWVQSYVEARSSTTPLNAWTHLALTSDGVHLRLYVNGELVQEHAATKVKAGIGDLKIGGTEFFGGAEYFTGKIDEVYLYNRALSEAEIKSDRHTAIQIAPSEDPIAAYPFDENEGEWAHDVGGNHDAKVEGAEWSRQIRLGCGIHRGQRKPAHGPRHRRHPP